LDGDGLFLGDGFFLGGAWRLARLAIEQHSFPG